MNDRQRAIERRKVELSARIDVQRFRLRLQARVLTQRPWLGQDRGGWRRKALIAGLVVAAGAALFLREQSTVSASPVWRIARLGGRLWVAGKLGLQLIRRQRRAHPQIAPVQGMPS